MTRYEYLQHMTSGEIFAVGMDQHERVILSIGPLERRELTHDPTDLEPNMLDDDNDWFAKHDAEFRLLDGAELAQVRAYATEAK